MVAINYDWDELEDNLDEEYDDSGNTLAEYTTEPYLYGDLISQRRSGNSRFHCFDGQGSTTALTDSSGNVTDTRSYTAFGEMTEQSGSTATRFQYIGQNGYYTDGVTGDYVVRQRALNSHFSRWRSIDIVPFVDGSNNYLYVLNRPLHLVDPSGALCVVCEWRRRMNGEDIDSLDAKLLLPIHRLGVEWWLGLSKREFYETIGEFKKIYPGYKWSTPPFPRVQQYRPFALAFSSAPKQHEVVATYAPFALEAYVCGDDCRVSVTEIENRWEYDKGSRSWKQVAVNVVTHPLNNTIPLNPIGGRSDSVALITRVDDPKSRGGCTHVIVITDVPTLFHFVSEKEFQVRVVQARFYISDGAFVSEAKSAYNKFTWRDSLRTANPPWAPTFGIVGKRRTSKTMGNSDDCC